MLHNQQSPTWRLISTTPPFSYLLDYDPSWTWKISHLHIHSWRPNETEHELIFSLITPFVNMSTWFWLVCIFSYFKCPSSKIDRMKWYLSCICWVLEWKAEFFARWMVLSLSQYNLQFSYFFPNSSINLCNQIISLLASSNILFLCCWKFNNLLQFQNSTYCCSTYSKNISYGAPPTIFITCYIGVNISL